jgi:hypothetical protein
LPTNWTVLNIITFAGAAALFIIGILTTAGVTVPSGVSSTVQVILGNAVMIAGVIVALIHLVSHNSTVKAAIAANWTHEDIRKL